MAAASQPPRASTGSLTTTLLKSGPDLLTLATQSPFLVKAGEGRLTRTTLSEWLSQDRLYAQAYIGFIGALITRVDLPSEFVSEDAKPSSLPWRIATLLSGCLQNIHKELGFFADVAKRYDLDLEQSVQADTAFAANNTTEAYIELFQSFGKDPELSLLDGLVVLWATEQCYLSAWRYARSLLDDNKGDEDLDGGALRKEFIPNWTSEDFEKFVAEIANVTNLLAEGVSASLNRHETTWKKVLKIETDFWPKI